MDKQDDRAKGNDIVTSVCLVVATIVIGILVANLPFGIVR